jgi:hypothetical protein
MKKRCIAALASSQRLGRAGFGPCLSCGVFSSRWPHRSLTASPVGGSLSHQREDVHPVFSIQQPVKQDASFSLHAQDPQRKAATPAGQRSAEIHSGARPELVRREPAESVRLKRRIRIHLLFSYPYSWTMLTILLSTSSNPRFYKAGVFKSYTYLAVSSG